MSVSSKLYKFNPFLDEHGLIRGGGRLQYSQLVFGTCHQIILGRHRLTEILIRSHHVDKMHLGVEALVALLQQRFWIISGRRMARSVKQSCVTCRRFDAKPCDQVTAPLPAERKIGA